MARYDWNQEPVLIYEQGVQVGNPIRRVVFQNAGASLLRKERPDAAGFCNYQGAIAAVHRTREGAYIIERTEPLIRGFKPLVGIWD